MIFTRKVCVTEVTIYMAHLKKPNGRLKKKLNFSRYKFLTHTVQIILGALSCQRVPIEAIAILFSVDVPNFCVSLDILFSNKYASNLLRYSSRDPPSENTANVILLISLMLVLCTRGFLYHLRRQMSKCGKFWVLEILKKYRK